jgi:hypothetical protein
MSALETRLLPRDADLHEVRPSQLKRAIAFYENGAERLLGVEAVPAAPGVSRTVHPGPNTRMFLKPGS